jgi:hypothetical protein
MRNNRQLDRHLQGLKLKLAVDETTHMPIRVVADGATEQLELFDKEPLGSESVPADDSQADGDGEQTEKR